MKTLRPKFASLELSEASRWLDRSGIICQEKLDGCWDERHMGGSLFVGEKMNDGSFIPFDVPFVSGQDLRREPLHFRLAVLREECLRLNLPSIATGYGVEFLEAVLARGGEGIVAKPLDSYFGLYWTKIKRTQTFDCVVTSKDHTRQSVAITLNGSEAGRCKLPPKDFASVQVGSVVEVTCHSIHPSGKLREPRFIRQRLDKCALVDAVV